MTEFEQAKNWRLANNWTLDELADLTGYSRSSLVWFERGHNPDSRPIDPFAWRRFKRICHSISVSKELTFKWGN